MDNNKETILAYIKSLENKIATQDKIINKLKTEKERYKIILFVLCILSIISSGISISLLI